MPEYFKYLAFIQINYKFVKADMGYKEIQIY